MARGLRVAVVVALLASVLCGGVYAQRFFREGSMAARYAPPHMPDASFVICRLEYERVRYEESGIGWRTDYPYAEVNLTTRFAELTKTRVSRDHDGTPNFYVVKASSETLFNCPIIVASDAGTIGFDEKEVLGLRQYLMKGGFLWVDDFWGPDAWDHWASEIARVLPLPAFTIEEVRLDDPMLRTMFHLDHVPQITNIQFWRRSGGLSTSERGPDSEEVHLRTIRDAKGRIMVLMTHNTDVADSWEREGEDRAFFERFSPSGYALGIDVLVHVMTH